MRINLRLSILVLIAGVLLPPLAWSAPGGAPDELSAGRVATAMRNGGWPEDAVTRAQDIVREAHQQGLPTEPIVNKALEAIAKRVPPARALQAMEAVRARYSIAYAHARGLARRPEQVSSLAHVMAEALTAGLREPQLEDIVQALQAQSQRLDEDGMRELGAACLAMARDMSRLGISSALTGEVVAGAVSAGLNAAAVASMNQGLIAQSQSQSAQSVAEGLAHGVSQGHGAAAHGGQGGAGGSSGGAGGGGSGGGGGGAGGGGGSGGGGGGAGGGGGGGPGGGNR
jgi:hypothetical protein